MLAFSRMMAPLSSATEMRRAAMAWGSTITCNSRSKPPKTLPWATPGTRSMAVSTTSSAKSR